MPPAVPHSSRQLFLSQPPAVPRGTAHMQTFQILIKNHFFRFQPTPLPPSAGRSPKEYPEVNLSQPKYKNQGVS